MKDGKRRGEVGERRMARPENMTGIVAVCLSLLAGALPAETAASFRAALYRASYQPNLISDVGAPARYSTLSLWDTFRAAHPLYLSSRCAAASPPHSRASAGIMRVWNNSMSVTE